MEYNTTQKQVQMLQHRAMSAEHVAHAALSCLQMNVSHVQDVNLRLVVSGRHCVLCLTVWGVRARCDSSESGLEAHVNVVCHKTSLISTLIKKEPSLPLLVIEETSVAPLKML